MAEFTVNAQRFDPYKNFKFLVLVGENHQLVVPAKAGTHNHRCSLMRTRQERQRTPFFSCRLRRMGPRLRP
jgi:hypothetical protein